MKIERMRAEHVPELARLERLCFTSPWSENAISEELSNPAASFYTALIDGRVAGYAGMYQSAGECYMYNVAVFPEYRRRGAARALLNKLEAEARQNGAEFISLEVRQSNSGAIALYTQLGYREEGRRKGFYSNPKEDGLIYTKRF